MVCGWLIKGVDVIANLISLCIAVHIFGSYVAKGQGPLPIQLVLLCCLELQFAKGVVFPSDDHITRTRGGLQRLCN